METSPECRTWLHKSPSNSAKRMCTILQVNVEPQTKVIEKHIVHSKPHRHHVHKTAFIGGYIGADAGVAATPETVVYESVQPVIERKVDVGTQGTVVAGTGIAGGTHGSRGGQVTYTKEVTVGRNPEFFQQIFNVSINSLENNKNYLENNKIRSQKWMSKHLIFCFRLTF